MRIDQVATKACAIIAIVTTTTIWSNGAVRADAFREGSLTIVHDFEGFTGAGFAPTPGPGQLDSDAIIVEGLSDGVLPFGGAAGTGDFARGASAGGVTTGGVYAFDVSNGGPVNRALGVQPIGSDFTPGGVTFRVRNLTGHDVVEIVSSFRIYAYNDAGRAGAIVWAHARDDGPFTDFGESVLSPETAAADPTWSVLIEHRVSIPFDSPLPDGAAFSFRFRGDDASGTGSRDEFAFDDVTFTAIVPEPASVAPLAVAALWCRPRRRRSMLASDRSNASCPHP